MDSLKCTYPGGAHPEEACVRNPEPFYLWRIQSLCHSICKCCYVRSEPHPDGGTEYYTQLPPHEQQDICQEHKMLRKVDAPVHLGGYSDGKHIQLICDKSWIEPKWGKEEDQRTTDPKVYVADDDRLYTFDNEKVTCKGCE